MYVCASDRSVIYSRSSGDEELEARSGALRRPVKEWVEWAMLEANVSDCIVGILGPWRACRFLSRWLGLDFGMFFVVILASG